MTSPPADLRGALALICGLDHAAIAEETAVFGVAGLPFRRVLARTEEDYLRACGEADAVLVQYGAFSRRVFEGLPRLRVLVRYGVGVDGIDLGAATDHGVPVVNVPDYGTDEVATQAVALLLALVRKITRLDRQTRAGRWDVFQVGGISRLAGRTVGIIGCGRIGGSVARKLSGFDVRLLGCDPYITVFPPGVLPVPLHRLLAESDYVTVHCPLTAETRHLLDAGTLALMRPTAILVNTARGGIVDEAALHSALTQGVIRGAGLDVFDREPTAPDNPLLTLDSVITAPHMAGVTKESFDRMAIAVANNLLSVLDGKPNVDNVVNKEVLGHR